MEVPGEKGRSKYGLGRVLHLCSDQSHELGEAGWGSVTMLAALGSSELSAGYKASSLTLAGPS